MYKIIIKLILVVKVKNCTVQVETTLYVGLPTLYTVKEFHFSLLDLGLILLIFYSGSFLVLLLNTNCY